jgi:hypothetical protein
VEGALGLAVERLGFNDLKAEQRGNINEVETQM